MSSSAESVVSTSCQKQKCIKVFSAFDMGTDSAETVANSSFRKTLMEVVYNLVKLRCGVALQGLLDRIFPAG